MTSMDDNLPPRTPSAAERMSGSAASAEARQSAEEPGADVACEAPRAARRQPAYVRKPRPHRTQPPVNDVTADDEIGRGYAYDSSYTVSGRAGLRSGAYRRAHSSEAKVRQELKYGQYLSVPKGSREIFSQHNGARQKRVVAVAAVIVVLVVLIIMLWPK